MGLVKVTTPVPDYTGSVGGVHFSSGVGYADPDKHESELAYFRARGYGVDEPQAEQPEMAGDEPAPKPAGNASTETWRTWAVDHGGMPADEAGQLSRDELVARFADLEENS